MSDLKELKDNELELVTGGGGGPLPAEGIKFNTYTQVEPGYYYARYLNDFSKVVFVYNNPKWSTGLAYTIEEFSIYEYNNWWASNSVPGYEGCVDNKFMKDFPYQLNVRP